MRHMVRRPLVGGVVVASVLALSSAPAYALGYVAAPGGPITGTNVGNLVITDGTKGTSITCDQSTFTGAALTNPSISKIFKLATMTLDHTQWPSTDECKGLGNLRIILTLGGLPYYFHRASTFAGVSTGTIASDHVSGVHLALHTSDGCDAIIGASGVAAGQVPGKFTNSTDRLQLIAGGNLIVKTVDAECDPTLIAVGDSISITGTYVITPAQDIVYVP